MKADTINIINSDARAMRAMQVLEQQLQQAERREQFSQQQNQQQLLQAQQQTIADLVQAKQQHQLPEQAIDDALKAIIDSGNVELARGLLTQLIEQEQSILEQQQQAADDVEVNQFNQQVSQMVDKRAQELQSVPIQKSDGTVAPMGFDTAIRLAQEEVGLQLRAQGIV